MKFCIVALGLLLFPRRGFCRRAAGRVVRCGLLLQEIKWLYREDFRRIHRCRYRGTRDMDTLGRNWFEPDRAFV